MDGDGGWATLSARPKAPVKELESRTTNAPGSLSRSRLMADCRNRSGHGDGDVGWPTRKAWAWEKNNKSVVSFVIQNAKRGARGVEAKDVQTSHAERVKQGIPEAILSFCGARLSDVFGTTRLN